MLQNKKASAADISEQKTSAADVPMAEKEMTVSQNSVVGDAPEQKVSEADVPTPDVPNVPTSVADVPTDSTVPQSSSVATPHESVPEKIDSEGDVPTNATDLTVPPTDSMAQTSQKEYGQCSHFVQISHSILCKLILSLLSQLFSRNLVMNIKLYWYLF